MQRTKRGAVVVFLCIGCNATPGDPQDAFDTMSETSADDDDGDDDDGNDGPVDDGPADDGPADDGPADDGPADDGPADDGPADDGPADDGPLDDDGTTDGGPADDDGTSDDDGTTDEDDGGETGPADCMSIADAATCMATEGCEWFGDDMFGACVGGFPGVTDTEGATSFGDTEFGESGFGDFCEGFDMAICDATGFCVWNAGEGVCESP
jgi:hypothetical protein